MSTNRPSSSPGSSRPSGLALALLCTGALAWLPSGCAEERPRTQKQGCTTWDDVRQALLSECGACHDSSTMSGSYDISTYLSTLGPGSDETANAKAGDPSSLLLAKIDPDLADANHAGFAELRDLLTRWVVDCELWYVSSRIHEGGIMNPEDPAFHGALLEATAWDFESCAECHGADFAGGTSKATCLTCHDQGPTDCQTCHGASPETGAHLAHTTPFSLGAVYGCDTCHVMPEDYRDPGHIYVMGAPELADSAPAEVVFNDLARGPNPAEPPSYDASTGRCDNVYCHGASLGDGNALGTAPTWQDPQSGACGSCHGLGPSSHADDRCAVCHQRVVDENRAFVDAALHVDKAVSVGAGTGETCTECHGPPRDLSGRTDTDLVTVGAHQSHVDARHGLRGPIPCADCHAMPQAVDSPGHIDSPAPAEVFAGVMGPFSGLAAAKGAMPVWDRANATCADVYCHGGGTSTLGDDTAPGLLRTPTWTALGVGQAACTTCHGVPPTTPDHTPDMTLGSCYTCHPRTVDPYGNIIISGPPGARTSEHIDGEFDL